jgi:hypothetical protein
MASPDGMVYHCPRGIRTGRLIEIKCPVTREMDGTIPKDYYIQMQLQLHVTGLKRCDYVEAEFASPYGSMAPKEGPALYSGFIALVYCRHTDEEQEGGRFEYRYSPLHVTEEWEPMLVSSEEVVEKIPWRLFKWSEQLVLRNEEWWEALQPALRTFWDDVERAKRGEFVVPESTRPSKKAKKATEPPPCLIQFQRLDEHGQPYQEEPPYQEEAVSGVAL